MTLRVYYSHMLGQLICVSIISKDCKVFAAAWTACWALHHVMGMLLQHIIAVIVVEVLAAGLLAGVGIAVAFVIIVVPRTI